MIMELEFLNFNPRRRVWVVVIIVIFLWVSVMLIALAYPRNIMLQATPLVLSTVQVYFLMHWQSDILTHNALFFLLPKTYSL